MSAEVEAKGGSNHSLKDATTVQHVEVAGEVELERRFSFLSCLGLAFALLNSWTGGFRTSWVELTASNVSKHSGWQYACLVSRADTAVVVQVRLVSLLPHSLDTDTPVFPSDFPQAGASLWYGALWSRQPERSLWVLRCKLGCKQVPTMHPYQPVAPWHILAQYIGLWRLERA
jgi:hypothetical protein